jgi:16S rRNA processing protein RimM
MKSDSSIWVILAHLLRPQGRKGEVLADLFTDFPERFAGREELFLVPSGFTGDRSIARRVDITSSWLPTGKNKGRVVLQFAGIDTISAAEAVSGFDLAIPDDRRMPLDEKSTYISDLVGCTLLDDAVPVGKISDVQFPASSEGARLAEAAPLLTVLAKDGSEILVPYVKAFVRNLDLTARRLVMSLPIGLVEVNRRQD